MDKKAKRFTLIHANSDQSNIDVLLDALAWYKFNIICTGATADAVLSFIERQKKGIKEHYPKEKIDVGITLVPSSDEIEKTVLTSIHYSRFKLIGDSTYKLRQRQIRGIHLVACTLSPLYEPKDEKTLEEVLKNIKERKIIMYALRTNVPVVTDPYLGYSSLVEEIHTGGGVIHTKTRDRMNNKAFNKLSQYYATLREGGIQHEQLESESRYLKQIAKKFK